MFISRKSIRINSNKNKVINYSQQNGEVVQTSISKQTSNKNKIQLTHYPIIWYCTATIFNALGIYLLYSANGGNDSIPDFNQKKWWQFVLSLLPLGIGVFLFGYAVTETVLIDKQSNKIVFLRKICLGFKIKQFKERELKDLINISIVKKGVQLITFTNSYYSLAFSFQTCEEISAFQCTSEQSAFSFYEQIRKNIPNLAYQQNSTMIKNLVNAFGSNQDRKYTNRY